MLTGDSKKKFLKRLGIYFYYGCVISLSLLFIFRIFNIIWNFGENNPNNDDYYFIDLFSYFFGGNVKFSEIIGGLFYRGHFMVIPFLFQLGGYLISKTNFYITPLYVGLILFCVKTLFLFDIVTFPSKNRLKWVLLPILAALQFSYSQVSTFEYPFASLSEALYQFGLILGIWGLMRFPKKKLAIMIMGIGGFISSWSYGGGPIVWPIYLIGLIGLKFRKKYYYVVWLIFAIISTFPYFYFFQNEFKNFADNFSFFNYPLIVEAMGWPFSQGFSRVTATHRGIVGLAFLISGLLLLSLRKNEKVVRRMIPCLMLIGFVLLNIYQISIFRISLVPWYASPFMLFWSGLIGIAFQYFEIRHEKPFGKNKIIKEIYLFTTVWSVALFTITGFFYFTSNLTWEDKSYFLKYRSPASASCLRNYSKAPTYCEPTLFCCRIGLFQQIPKLGKFLKENNLSVFGKKQTWSLQGEFLLDSVKIKQNKGIPNIFWSPNLTSERGSFLDFRHMNLFLHTPNSVDWTVTLPGQLQKAIFKTGIAISQSAPLEEVSDGVNFKIDVYKKNGQSESILDQFVAAEKRNWIPIELDLTKFAGEEITVRLTSDKVGNIIHDWAMFRYPNIEITLKKQGEKRTFESQLIRPENTNMSAEKVKVSPEDPLISQTDPNMKYCLMDFNKIYFKLPGYENILPGGIHVFLQFKNQQGFQTDFYVPWINLYPFNEFTYNLKLLNIDQNSILTKIKVEPYFNNVIKGQKILQNIEIRLIRGEEMLGCA